LLRRDVAHDAGALRKRVLGIRVGAGRFQ
jgi:hypothetical protein